MGMFASASKAAFEQYGRRHERTLIRVHVWRIIVTWLLLGTFALFVLRIGWPDVYTSVSPFVTWPLAIVSAWPFVVIIAGVMLIALPHIRRIVRRRRMMRHADPTVAIWEPEDGA